MAEEGREAAAMDPTCNDAAEEEVAAEQERAQVGSIGRHRCRQRKCVRQRRLHTQTAGGAVSEDGARSGREVILPAWRLVHPLGLAVIWANET